MVKPLAMSKSGDKKGRADYDDPTLFKNRHTGVHLPACQVVPMAGNLHGREQKLLSMFDKIGHPNTGK